MTFLGVSNTDGTTARQLGVEWLDGKLMSYFVFDVGKAQLQNLKGEPVVDNKTVIATFPWDAVRPRCCLELRRWDIGRGPRR